MLEVYAHIGGERDTLRGPVVQALAERLRDLVHKGAALRHMPDHGESWSWFLPQFGSLTQQFRVLHSFLDMSLENLKFEGGVVGRGTYIVVVLKGAKQADIEAMREVIDIFAQESSPPWNITYKTADQAKTTRSVTI